MSMTKLMLVPCLSKALTFNLLPSVTELSSHSADVSGKPFLSEVHTLPPLREGGVASFKSWVPLKIHACRCLCQS